MFFFITCLYYLLVINYTTCYYSYKINYVLLFKGSYVLLFKDLPTKKILATCLLPTYLYVNLLVITLLPVDLFLLQITDRWLPSSLNYLKIIADECSSQKIYCCQHLKHKDFLEFLNFLFVTNHQSYCVGCSKLTSV